MASIKTVLDLDRTKFDASLSVGAQKFNQAFGLQKVSGFGKELPGQAEKLGEEVSRRFHRSFGLGDAVKGLLMGAGINTIEKVTQKIASYWEQAAKSAEKIGDESERALKATLKLLDFRRTDPQRLASLQKDAAGMQGELAVLNRNSGLNTPQEAERAAKLDADLKENAVAQFELKKKIGEQALKNYTEDRAAAQKIYEEQSKRAYEALTLEGKLAEQKRRSASFDEQAARTASGPARSELMLKAEEAITEQKRLQSAIAKQDADKAKEAQEEWDRALKEEERSREKINRLWEAYESAQKKMAQTQAGLTTASEDRFRLGVGDAASGTGTSSDRARARQILSLEKRARDVYANNADMRDASGRTLSAADYSRNLLSRADQLRDYGRFKSDDRDPLGANKQLADAASDLKQAAENLKEVDVEVSDYSEN